MRVSAVDHISILDMVPSQEMKNKQEEDIIVEYDGQIDLIVKILYSDSYDLYVKNRRMIVARLTKCPFYLSKCSYRVCKDALLSDVRLIESLGSYVKYHNLVGYVSLFTIVFQVIDNILSEEKDIIGRKWYIQVLFYMKNTSLLKKHLGEEDKTLLLDIQEIL